MTFELAQEEIASKAGFDVVGVEDQSMETALLNKSLLELLPAVDEANAISQELGKSVHFETALVSSSYLGKDSDRTEVKLNLITVFCLQNAFSSHKRSEKLEQKIFQQKKTHFLK